MPSPDWADTPYVKVYGTLARDHADVWNSPELLGAYVRALFAADRVWPAPAELPRAIDAETAGALVAAGILEPVDGPGALYRFHGLDAERNEQNRRLDWHSAGGKARARGPRRPDGTLMPVRQQVQAPASQTNGKMAPPASHQLQQEPADQHQTPLTTTTPALSGLGGSSSSQQPAGLLDKTPAYDCANPNHNSPPVRSKSAPGAGWFCPDCVREAAERDRAAGRSFRAKVEKHGGWVPPAPGHADDAP